MYITYYVDPSDKKKIGDAPQLACNFWNHFVVPKHPIVIKVYRFTRTLKYWKTTGRASNPELRDGTIYCSVGLNKTLTKYWSQESIAGTIAHEIGHCLGIGWEEWDTLYDEQTGAFLPDAVAQVPALAQMRVEMDKKEPQKYAHWDEGTFGDELMTPYKDTAPYVLPVTIEVMTLLGHTVRRQLNAATPLAELLTLPPREATVNAAKADAETVKAAADFEAPDFEVLPM